MAATRLFRPALALLLAVPLLAGVPAGAAPVVAKVRVDRDAFWTAAAAPVEERSGTFWRAYPIEVAKGGRRLRLAVDHPDFRVFLDWAVVQPNGKRVAMPVIYNTSEAYFDNPAAGRWLVEVNLPEADYADFRMRARLEREVPKPPAGKTPLLPNLRLVPPYEFTFSTALVLARETNLPPQLPASCTPDDVASHQAVRCLRFSVGPANVGAGPVSLRFPGGEGVVTPGRATQRIQWSDGTWTEREAGGFQYHATHMHYHHTGFGSLELLRVTDPAKGTMQPAGGGPKQGFCTGDILLSDWTSFANAPQFSAPSRCLEDMGPVNNYDPNAGTEMGLSAGWADIYSWEQDGNYVDFPVTDGDGHYVVRSTADAAGSVLESDENDNTGYAYIKVTGSTVAVIERGRGQSPWDPRKVVVRDGLHPLA